MLMLESFSGVRGIWGNDLSKEHIKKYAISLYYFLQEKENKKNLKIIIGRDSRPSGKEISDEFIKYFLDFGIDVIDVGLRPTPVIENAVRSFKADLGLIITASHNPPEHNGWKILEKRGNVLYPEEMEMVIANTKKDLELPKYKTKGDLYQKSLEALNDYILFLEETLEETGIKKEIFLHKNLKILADPNGGAASQITPSILKRLKIDCLEVNNEIGKFERQIEPNKKSLAYLQEMLQKDEFTLAAGFDCDADRVELVSKKYGVVSGQYVLGLISEYLLGRLESKKGRFVSNDATSYLVKDIVLKNNFSWFEAEVGEVNIVKEHDKNAIVLGGEGSSGGVIIPSSRCRDGIMTVVFVLAFLAESDLSLDEALDLLPRYYTFVDKIKTNSTWEKFRIEIIEKIKKENLSFKTTGDKTGGVKVFFKNAWFWFRGSKTEEGVIRIMSDSKNEILAKELLGKARSYFSDKL